MLTLNKLFVSAAIVGLSFVNTQVFALSDSDITTHVKERISADKATANSKIDVETKNGVVTLTGKVETEGEATAAIQDANSVVGVKDVESNKLLVKDKPFTDAYITAKVKGAFLRDKVFGDEPIDVIGIHVETKNGVVHLTGTAETKAQEENAVKLAKAVKGVKEVKSTVVIKPKA